MLIFRQGDVLVVERTDNLPAQMTEVERDNGAVILAYGEVTGHSHAIAEDDVTLFMPSFATNVRILQVGEGGATLRHDEHNPIVIPQGTYDVIIQSEFHDEEFRQVID